MKSQQQFSGDTSAIISGTAQITVKNGAAGEVYFYVTDSRGSRAIHGRIMGDPALLSAAWRAKRATLLLNKRFAVKVLGRDRSNGALLIDGRSLFRAFASQSTGAAYEVKQKLWMRWPATKASVRN